MRKLAFVVAVLVLGTLSTAIAGEFPTGIVNQRLMEAAAAGDIQKIKEYEAFRGDLDAAGIAAAEHGQAKALQLLAELDNARYTVRTEAGPIEIAFWQTAFVQTQEVRSFGASYKDPVAVQQAVKPLAPEEIIGLGLDPNRKLHRGEFHDQQTAYALGITCSQSVLEAAVLENFDTQVIELLAAKSSDTTKAAGINMIAKAKKWGRKYPLQWEEAVARILAPAKK